MKKNLIISSFLFLSICELISQTTYKMNNGYSGDCKGILKDSETNQVNTTYYSSGEKLTFKVCIKGASSIVIKFQNTFAIETNNDYLRIHKGADTSGTLIGKYTGTTRPGGTITVNDSCVTFYFHSDANYNLEGFELNWEAKITTVPQPRFSNITNPDCNANTIRVTLDQKFHCDSIKAANFRLSGTLSTAVSSVTPINCDNQNLTNTFDVTFASGLNKSGNYSLDFNAKFKDRCDSIWNITARLNFSITNCPIDVDLRTNTTVVCRGGCANLTAVITGGNSANYTYTWLSGGLTGAPPRTVCPTTKTKYILQVSDGVSVPGKDSVEIDVLDPPVAQNDTWVCQNSGQFNLTASPAGGTWSGTGITFPANGTFRPATSGVGVFKIFYTIGTCRDSVMVTVRAFSAGVPNAACPSSAPFMVTNFTPAGGVWSGAHITPAGVFTPPSTTGSYTVTYTWNGCTQDKIINIDGISIKKFDTICRSKPLDTIKNFSPIGGNWTGPGITNTRLGISNPTIAGAGNNKLYIYVINGCRDTLIRTINEADARWDEIYCPEMGQITMPGGLPAGGFWKGKGIFDPINGIFDADSFRMPSRSTFVSTTLTYQALNGCKDDKIVYLRYTRFYSDTIKKCSYDTNFFMRNFYLNNDPWNMFFTGSNAIIGNTVYSQKFSPWIAGKNSYHNIIGTANGCTDSMILYVYPRARIQTDTNFCVLDDPYRLRNLEGKGTFSGRGITNGALGIFNPAVAGVGNHIISFNLPGRCTDTLRITVNPAPVAQMSGLKNFYCYRDTLIKINLNPKNGIITGGNLAPSDSFFNPKKAGSGFHTITYKVGTGKCSNSTSFETEVGDTLKATLTSTKDSVCRGVSVQLETKAKGGSGTYYYQWSSGQTGVSTIFEVPKSTTNYTVNVKDGCSDPVVLSKQVYVHPSFYGNVVTSPIKCYGETGFAQINMIPSGNYTYYWNTIPVQTTSTITAPVATTYRVKVTDPLTKCFYDTVATIPGYDKIRAYFITSPSGRCVYTSNPEIQIIDLSEGGKSGAWDFGDGNLQSYNSQQSPTYTYVPEEENYTIRLYIQNEGGCKDSFSAPVCFLDTISLFMPTAFTPNDDGTNEIFIHNTFSVVEVEFQIYNRWGERLFYTTDIKQGWDGKYQGKICPNDYYYYTIMYKGKKTPRKYSSGVFYILR